MPRTPLMRRLKSLAARAETARALGIPFHSFDARPRALVTRREFVRGTAATAALAALGPASWGRAKQAASQAGGSGVAIVGAGLAGLAAARRLRQQGWIVPVYEASARIGGRIFTDAKSFVSSGQRVERGGELIDSGHKRMRKLVKQLGLELDDLLAAEPAGTQPGAQFDGCDYSFATAEQDFAALYPKLHKDVVKAGYPTTYTSSKPHGAWLDTLSIEEWIELRVPGGNAAPLGKLLSVAYDIEYGAPVGAQSALNLVYLLGYGSTPNGFALFGESDERFRVRGGNEQVVQRLAALLPGQIRLGHRLVAAQTLADGRTRLCFDTDGGVVEQVHERVILALPFAVLRASVDIAGLELTPKKRQAIEQQGMGTNVKLHVQFVDRHWYGLGSNGECFGDTGFQNTWEETRAQAGAEGILNNYLGSNGPTLESLPSEGSAENFLPQIEPLLPGITGKWNGLASIDYWPGSPHQLGSYSFWKVGQYTGFAGVEAEVEGRVHFAGEHTSIDFQGYMEGALESGLRAAAEVLAAG
jgi:monoamine oxidase